MIPVKPKRNLPFDTLDSMKSEIDRVQDRGVIEKIGYSEWATLVVNIRKKNKSRLFANFSTCLV